MQREIQLDGVLYTTIEIKILPNSVGIYRFTIDSLERKRNDVIVFEEFFQNKISLITAKISVFASEKTHINPACEHRL